MGYSIEKAQKKSEELRQRKFRKDYWGPKPGQNFIRILPNWRGEFNEDFFRETGYHRKLGQDRDKSVVCLRKEGFENCPICELVSKLYKTKNAEDIDLAKSIKVQHRVIFNIVDLSEIDKGIQPWISGVDVLEQIIGYCANPKYGDITDIESGRNVTLIFTEGKNTKSKYNEYDIQPDPDRTPITDPSWIEQMIDLDSLVKPNTEEEVVSLLYGTGILAKEEAKEERKEELKTPSCFERAKFSPDDADCAVCLVKIKCKEKKKISKSESIESKVIDEKVIEKSKVIDEKVIEKSKVIDEKPKQVESGNVDAKRKIQEMVDKIRKERKRD